MGNGCSRCFDFINAVISAPGDTLSKIIVVSLLNDAIKTVFHAAVKTVEYVQKTWDNVAYYKIHINPKEDHRCKQAILEEIRSLGLHLNGSHPVRVSDGRLEPFCEISNGTYTLPDNETVGKVHIEITDDLIIVKAFAIPVLKKCPDQLSLLNYYKDLYKKHNSVDKVLVHYSPEKEDWTHPIFRPPRNFSALSLNNTVKQVMQKVDWFKANRDYFNDKGAPYRYGCFLYGEPGTGKSLITELISYRHEMPVYHITLNAKDMSDAVLRNLVAKIPPHSILVFDEFDKQIESMKRNPTVTISFGGILTALDGPERLSEGTIVILTANKKDFLSEEEQQCLFRDQRIDYVCEMKADPILPTSNIEEPVEDSEEQSHSANDVSNPKKRGSPDSSFEGSQPSSRKY